MWVRGVKENNKTHMERKTELVTHGVAKVCLPSRGMAWGYTTKRLPPNLTAIPGKEATENFKKSHLSTQTRLERHIDFTIVVFDSTRERRRRDGTQIGASAGVHKYVPIALLAILTESPPGVAQTRLQMEGIK